jgi:peptidyl-prolyl cis-trans isomerase SurA
MLVGISSGQAAVVSRVAAVVNADIITTHQLDQALKKEMSQMKASPSPAQIGALRKELLSRLIEEKLIQQRIDSLGLKVSEEELETALQDVQAQNQLSREDLKEAIMAQGLSFEEYCENLRSQILRYRLLGIEVRRKVDVSEGEVRDYYRAHLDDFREPPNITLSVLAFPVPERAGLAEREAIRSAANKAAELLAEGSGLEAVAEEFSREYGASSRSLGNVAQSELDPDLAAAIKGVEIGGFSPLIEKATALVLLRVDERHDAGLRQYYSVEEEIRQHLIEQKSDVRSKEWIKGLKQNAFIDIRI